MRDFERDYFIFTIIYSALFIILFYTLLCFSFRFTYELPTSSPGVLVSDRWTFDFVKEWLFWVYWLAPWTGLFMIMVKKRVGVVFHMIVLVLLLVWFGFNLAFDITELTNANVPPSDPNYKTTNLATDPRWCCVYGGQPGTALVCSVNTTVTPCPFTGSTDLSINNIFLLRFITLCVIGAALIFDFLTTIFVFVPKLNNYLKNITNKKI